MTAIRGYYCVVEVCMTVARLKPAFVRPRLALVEQRDRDQDVRLSQYLPYLDALMGDILLSHRDSRQPSPSFPLMDRSRRSPLRLMSQDAIS